MPTLPVALGASDLPLLEHASAFTVFPDDGVHIPPRMIYRVTNYDGRVIDDFQPEVTDVLPAADARLMVSMLREVFNSGTAVRGRALAAQYHLAGKTGTTNDFTDAWFLGFSPKLTCGVYVGFDDHRSLGDKEEGSHVALPIWMDFMSEALKDQPVEDFPYSPLLTSPDQVKQILASAAPERLLGEPSSGASPAGDQAATQGGAQGPEAKGPQGQSLSRPTATPAQPASATSPSSAAATPVAKKVSQSANNP